MKEGLNGVITIIIFVICYCSGFYGLLAKILAHLRLSINFFQLRLTKKLEINLFCFKELNINRSVSLKQNKGFRIISGSNKLFF